MPIERHWQLDLDEEDITRMQAESPARSRARPRKRAAWGDALAEAQELVQGAALWDFFTVGAIRHGRVHLAGGARFGGGPLAQVIAGSEELGLIVCTIGPALEERVRTHQRRGEMLRAVLLDNLGVWAVDKLRQEVCQRLEQEAAEVGLRVSTTLSPGESEWGVRDQRTLFSLLDAEQIGVSVNHRSLVMTPLQSLSLVMGRGVGPLGREGESHCDYCTVRDRCRYRERRVTIIRED